MTWLLIGLLIFLGVHSVRIVADDWRTRTIERLGAGAWKGIYSVLALLGLVLIVVGYGQARGSPTVLWASPLWTRHLAALLVLVAMVLIAASQVPGNHIRSKLRHPMVLGVKVWAVAHLLANNTVSDVLLFGTFLVWAVLSFRAARQRDRAAAPAALAMASPSASRTAAAVAAGVGVWAVLAFGGHTWLFGVSPFGAVG